MLRQKATLPLQCTIISSVIKLREVHVTGVDLKADVIARCNAVAGNLGLHGLTFCRGDILQYNPGLPSADMVISLPRLQHRHRHRWRARCGGL